MGACGVGGGGVVGGYGSPRGGVEGGGEVEGVALLGGGGKEAEAGFGVVVDDAGGGHRLGQIRTCGIGEADCELLVVLVEAVVDDGNGDGGRGGVGGHGECSRHRGVVVGMPGGVVEGGVLDGGDLGAGVGEGDGECRARVVLVGSGRGDAEPGKAVVADGNYGCGVEDDYSGGVAEGDGEGLLVLVEGVVDDGDGDGGLGGVGGHGECSRHRGVVVTGGSGSWGCGVLDGGDLGACVGEGDGEDGGAAILIDFDAADCR